MKPPGSMCPFLILRPSTTGRKYLRSLLPNDSISFGDKMNAFLSPALMPSLTWKTSLTVVSKVSSIFERMFSSRLGLGLQSAARLSFPTVTPVILQRCATREDEVLELSDDERPLLHFLRFRSASPDASRFSLDHNEVTAWESPSALAVLEKTATPTSTTAYLKIPWSPRMPRKVGVATSSKCRRHLSEEPILKMLAGRRVPTTP